MLGSACNLIKAASTEALASGRDHLAADDFVTAVDRYFVGMYLHPRHPFREGLAAAWTRRGGVSHADSVRPLVARVAPIAGESLMSLVARSAEANVFPRLGDLLAHAGVTGQPDYTPFTAGERVEPLAALLGVSVPEVAPRMHLPVADRLGRVGWRGWPWSGAGSRGAGGVSPPASFVQSAHHRLVWSLGWPCIAGWRAGLGGIGRPGPRNPGDHTP